MMGSLAKNTTLGMTISTCPKCGETIPAKIIAKDDEVFFLKFCPVHGESKSFVYRGVDDYLRTQRYVKPAAVPTAFHGDASKPCPEGCGFCERHEQHLCMPIVEITNRCDLRCPACINASGDAAPWDMTRDEFATVLKSLLKAEAQIDLLNISGGEPLLHPDLFTFIDMALDTPEIVRISVSTNGLQLLQEPGLVKKLHERNVDVSLQYDGENDAAYEVLRGQPLATEKRNVLDALAEADITTSLTMTAARHVNDDQFAHLLNTLFSHDNIVSLMIQPMAFAGRGASLRESAGRLTIPDVVRLLDEAEHPAVARQDFAPVPCSHPLCFHLAFYLMLDDGGTVALNKLTDATTLMDAIANKLFFGLEPGEHEKMKEMIYTLWCGPAGAVPESKSVLATLKKLLNELNKKTMNGPFDPREIFVLTERKVKSIFIHAFQDADTFDLSRTRRCCQAYVQPDGQMLPVCAHNVISRNDKRNHKDGL